MGAWLVAPLRPIKCFVKPPTAFCFLLQIGCCSFVKPRYCLLPSRGLRLHVEGQVLTRLGFSVRQRVGQRDGGGLTCAEETHRHASLWNMMIFSNPQLLWETELEPVLSARTRWGTCSHHRASLGLSRSMCRRLRLVSHICRLSDMSNYFGTKCTSGRFIETKSNPAEEVETAKNTPKKNWIITTSSPASTCPCRAVNPFSLHNQPLLNVARVVFSISFFGRTESKHNNGCKLRVPCMRQFICLRLFVNIYHIPIWIMDISDFVLRVWFILVMWGDTGKGRILWFYRLGDRCMLQVWERYKPIYLLDQRLGENRTM